MSISTSSTPPTHLLWAQRPTSPSPRPSSPLANAAVSCITCPPNPPRTCLSNRTLTDLIIMSSLYLPDTGPLGVVRGSKRQGIAHAELLLSLASLKIFRP